MKVIEVSDEMYVFLMNLSHLMKGQDNRFTASPYFYQVRDIEEVSVGEGQGVECWYCDGEVVRSDEEVKSVIFDHKGWELGNVEHERMYGEMDWLDKDTVMGENYRKVYVSTREVLTNVFLTERSCEEHIRSNRHHYNDPKSYVSYAGRNPEMEMLIKFLTSLTSKD